MDRPKRIKHRDNPYTLIYTINERYIVSFKDGKNVLQEVEVSQEIYEAFNYFELRDLSELNEYDNHIEHSEIFEETLNKRSTVKQESIDDSVIRKLTYEELMEAIKTLPEVQQRRIKKYYFNEQNEYEIALEEHTSHQAINKSLRLAKQKLKAILEKIYK